MSITGQGSNASCRVADSRSGALGEGSSECLEGAAKQGSTAGQLRTRTIFGFDAGENLAKPTSNVVASPVVDLRSRNSPKQAGNLSFRSLRG